MATNNDMLDYIKNMKVVKSNMDIVESAESPTQVNNVGPVAWGEEAPTTIVVKDKSSKVKIKPVTKTEPKVESVVKENDMLSDLPALADDRPFKLTKEYVVSLLKEYEREEIQRRTTYDKKTVNAYDLVGCIRKAYYGIKGVTEIPNANSYPYGEVVSAMGNAVHDILQKRIPSDSNELKIKITDQYDITINVRSDILWNKHVVVEIKSKDVVPKKPEPEHVVQAMVYAYLLNTFHDYEISLVQILYMSRGKVDIGIFDVPITPEYMDKIGNKIKVYTTSLMNYVDKDMAPPMDHQYVNTKSCFFCNYKHECQRHQQFESVGR